MKKFNLKAASIMLAAAMTAANAVPAFATSATSETESASGSLEGMISDDYGYGTDGSNGTGSLPNWSPYGTTAATTATTAAANPLPVISPTKPTTTNDLPTIPQTTSYPVPVISQPETLPTIPQTTALPTVAPITTTTALPTVAPATTTDGQIADNNNIYQITNGKATLIRCGQSGTTIEIPSTVQGYPVIAIGDYAFKGRSDVLELRIAEGIVTIGQYAFYDCQALEKVVLPGSLESIGDFAFHCGGVFYAPKYSYAYNYLGKFSIIMKDSETCDYTQPADAANAELTAANIVWFAQQYEEQKETAIAAYKKLNLNLDDTAHFVSAYFIDWNMDGIIDLVVDVANNNGEGGTCYVFTLMEGSFVQIYTGPIFSEVKVYYRDGNPNNYTYIVEKTEYDKGYKEVISFLSVSGTTFTVSAIAEKQVYNGLTTYIQYYGGQPMKITDETYASLEAQAFQGKKLDYNILAFNKYLTDRDRAIDESYNAFVNSLTREAKAKTVEVNGIYYLVGNRAANVCAADPNITEADVLPSIEGVPVRVIGDYGFKGCTQLKKFKGSYYLERLGAYSLYDCTQLQQVVLPETMSSIAQYALNCGATFIIPSDNDFLKQSFGNNPNVRVVYGSDYQ